MSLAGLSRNSHNHTVQLGCCAADKTAVEQQWRQLLSRASAAGVVSSRTKKLVMDGPRIKKEG
jgi:hypothetical protein